MKEINQKVQMSNKTEKKKKKKPRGICDRNRWSLSVFLSIGLCSLLVGTAVFFLYRQDAKPEGNSAVVPLHPISGTSYSKAAVAGGDVVPSHAHPHYNDDHYNEPDVMQNRSHRQNYRRRFSEAIKGVFNDMVGRNASEASQKEQPSKESTENNSSRLKRQLDFGSGSDEQNDDLNKTVSVSSSSTRKPILQLMQNLTRTPLRSASPMQPPADSSSSSSEETKSSPGSSSVENGKYQRKAYRRLRPKYKQLTSHENEDDNDDYISPERERKNFTLEVVQVERKVVRKEDGHIPTHFAKSTFNIQPRLAKVTKQEASNRPAVIYRKYQPPQVNDRQQRPSRRLGKALDVEPISDRDVSVGDDANDDEVEPINETSDDDTNDNEGKRVIVNLNEQMPHNEKDLSDEDLKDYHDGHSTFGSKGNFTHTIISRNVAGFIPNPRGASTESDASHEGLSKRSGGLQRRKIVIEKGRVTEKYPNESPSQENKNPEIYSVPGGRSSSTENYEPKQEAFPFTRIARPKANADPNQISPNEKSDRTSPVVPSSLEDLFRKGHPGVVRAPTTEDVSPNSYRRHSLSDPYGESADYQSPFNYDPLVDEPPLKFDPESDRFYGNPIPDKDRMAQSNIPVRAESRNGRGNNYANDEGYLKPLHRSRSSEEVNTPAESPVNEEDVTTSSEAPPDDNRGNNPTPNDRFYYGRAYDSPDYSDDYGSTDRDRNRDNDENDIPSYDFVGLDENFDTPRHDDAEPGAVDDGFFEFPGGRDFRPRAGARGREEGSENDNENVNNESREHQRGNDYDEDSERDQRVRRPPAPPPSENRNSDNEYESSREEGYGRFRNTPNGGGRDRGGDGEAEADEDTADEDSPPERYEPEFIQTLKQFDEEIKKLQDEERNKLLDTTPAAPPQQPLNSGGSRESSNGYRDKEPPLIITSPGPIQSSYSNPTGHGGSTTFSDNDEAAPPPPQESTESGSEEDFRSPSVTTRYDVVGDENDEEDTEGPSTNRNVGLDSTESYTERSGENEDDEEKKKKK